MESQPSFSKLFFEYLEHVMQHGLNGEEEIELHNRWVDLFEDYEISPAEVVQTMTEAFSRYGDHKLFLLLLMRTIATVSKMSGDYTYPEFFWIAVRSNILFETENINDIMTALLEFSNKETLRAFLTYRLMVGNEAERRHAIFAFYYTGFTADTLELVTELVSAEDVELYEYIYGTAMSTMFSDRAKNFSEDEKRYFRSFFERGIELEDLEIVKSSQAALRQIEIL